MIDLMRWRGLLNDTEDDLLMMFFARAPWQTLASLRCVCRRYRTLLTTRLFHRIRKELGWSEPVIFCSGIPREGDSEACRFMALMEERWFHMRSLPEPVGLHATAECGGYVVIAGHGTVDGEFCFDVYKYRPETNEWTIALNSVPREVFQSCRGCCSLDTTRLVCIGLSGSKDQVALALFNVDDDSWVLLPRAPIFAFGAALAALGNRIFVIGGLSRHPSTGPSDPAVSLDVVQAYDESTGDWTPETCLPQKLYFACAVTVGRKILVIGGRDESCNHLRTLFVFDVDSRAWNREADIPAGGPAGRLSAGLISASSVLVLTQSNTPGQSPAVYDADSRSWTLLDEKAAFASVLRQQPQWCSLPLVMRI